MSRRKPFILLFEEVIMVDCVSWHCIRYLYIVSLKKNLYFQNIAVFKSICNKEKLGHFHNLINLDPPSLSETRNLNQSFKKCFLHHIRGSCSILVLNVRVDGWCVGGLGDRSPAKFCVCGRVYKWCMYMYLGVVYALYNFS